MRRLFISLFLFAALTGAGQTKSFRPDKTLTDSVFSKGDIIKIPEIVYSTCCLGCLDYFVPGIQDSLNIIGGFIIKHPGYIFQITSHTDQRGNEQKNVELSRKRANAVKNYLMKSFSIDSTIIFSEGYGGRSPIINILKIKEAMTKEEKERLHQMNRRTELKVIDVK